MVHYSKYTGTATATGKKVAEWHWLPGDRDSVTPFVGCTCLIGAKNRRLDERVHPGLVAVVVERGAVNVETFLKLLKNTLTRLFPGLSHA